MSKSTPGPWKVCFNEPFLQIPGHAIKVDDSIERPIACLWVGGGTKGKPTQIANARLIASAPELLYACKEALAGYLVIQSTFDKPKDVQPMIDTLRQAIKKAEGGE